MDIPSELQTLVCRNLTKAQLKVARLVCKSFDQLAVPLLFEEVFIASSYSDLERADRIASRFRSFVRTITVSFVHFPSCLRGGYDRLWSRRWGTKILNRVDGHLEYAYEITCRFQREQEEIRESGEILAQMCHILGKTTRCRRIVLTCRGSPWKKEVLCPYPTCPLSKFEHQTFFGVQRDPPDSEDRGRYWFLTILALSVTRSRVTEIVVDGPRLGDGLPMSAFDTTVRRFTDVANCFKTLTKLSLSLSFSHHTGNSVASALSSATNLKSLFIEGDYEMFYDVLGPVSVFSAILGGCRFTNLRSLLMAKLSSGNIELLEFLRHSPLLNRLTICEFALKEGLWQEVALSLRAIFQLKRVKFDALIGGISDSYQLGFGESYSIDPQMVEDFFLRNGDNPFTEETVKLWNDKTRDEAGNAQEATP